MINQRLPSVVLTSPILLLILLIVIAQSQDRSKTLAEIASLKKQLNEKEKLFLSPSAEDKAAFADFLKQSNTGLIRLMLKGIYDDKLSMRGGGAYYSFTLLTHEYGPGTDINLEPFNSNSYIPPPVLDHIFNAGSPGCHGLIAQLGEVPLDQVTLEHKGAKFLVTYVPPSASPRPGEEIRRANTGIEQSGYVYKRNAPAITNHSYVLRSICYGRSDALVGFRIVRKEIDGSVVILWKRLKQFPKPERLQTVVR
jgi:hypothetical protein